MSRLVKACPNVCAMCKYRSGTRENGCNYMGIIGHSRIYVDGKPQYDTKYCDKFQRGKIEQGYVFRRKRTDEWPENGWQE